MQKLSIDIPENIAFILGGSIILLQFTLFIVILVIAYLKRGKRHLKEKALMEAEFEKQLLKSRLETQEETLHKLSAEIHDNVGQLLNSTKLLIGITQRTLMHVPVPITDLNTALAEAIQQQGSVPDSQNTLAMADETLAKAILELRTLSRSINREWLEQFNFIQNLESEIKRIHTARTIQIQFSRPDHLSLVADEQIILFRIVQEVLQNAIKHSGASNIDMRIKEENGVLNVTISDDGNGFDENVITKSMGMLNINHRSKLLGGSAQWHSEVGSGTRVSIQIPINPESI